MSEKKIDEMINDIRELKKQNNDIKERNKKKNNDIDEFINKISNMKESDIDELYNSLIPDYKRKFDSEVDFYFAIYAAKDIGNEQALKKARKEVVKNRYFHTPPSEQKSHGQHLATMTLEEVYEDETESEFMDRLRIERDFLIASQDYSIEQADIEAQKKVIRYNPIIQCDEDRDER